MVSLNYMGPRTLRASRTDHNRRKSSVSRLNNNWKLILTAVMLSAALGAGYYLSLPGSVDSYVFAGRVAEVTRNGQVVMEGSFLGRNLPDEVAAPRELSFRTDATTRFVRFEAKFPTPEELAATDGVFHLRDLPLTQAPGSLADLEAAQENSVAMQVTAEFERPAHRAREPLAKMVTYRILFSPGPAGGGQ